FDRALRPRRDALFMYLQDLNNTSANGSQSGDGNAERFFPHKTPPYGAPVVISTRRSSASERLGEVLLSPQTVVWIFSDGTPSRINWLETLKARFMDCFRLTIFDSTGSETSVRVLAKPSTLTRSTGANFACSATWLKTC